MKEYRFKINGRSYDVAVNCVEDGMAELTVNGASYSVGIESGAASPACAARALGVSGVPASDRATLGTVRGGTVKLCGTVGPERSEGVVGGNCRNASTAAQAGGTVVKSPLPGVVIEIVVREGQAVRAGQKIAVLEAMKMENEIQAPTGGTIRTIHVQAGGSVLEGADLFTID